MHHASRQLVEQKTATVLVEACHVLAIMAHVDVLRTEWRQDEDFAHFARLSVSRQNDVHNSPVVGLRVELAVCWAVAGSDFLHGCLSGSFVLQNAHTLP